MDLARVAAVLDELPNVERAVLRTTVRETLDALVAEHPGRAVEVRVAPHAAVQILGGATHRRGTPPAVVETDAATWLALVLGRVMWAEAVADGRVRASGERCDLSALVPFARMAT